MTAMIRTLIASVLPILVHLTTPVPRKPPGFVYKYGNVSDVPVHLDVYVGPLCPDSARAFPTMLQVADHFGPNKLRLRMHMFPLPYHRNAFLVCMGTHSANEMKPTSMVYTWMEAVYNNLATFFDKTLTEDTVVTKMSELANSMMNVTSKVFESTVVKSSINYDCRVEFKHGCSRGVTSTPTFMINDVIVGGDERSSQTADEWIKYIQQLV